MGVLLRRRLEIGDLLDQAIDEFGILYGELVQLQTAIVRQAGNLSSPPNSSRYPAAPPWVAESKTAEVLRNRLAMELAEHSSGGANQTILGPVTSRETLVKIFTKQHASVRKEEAPPPAAGDSKVEPAREATDPKWVER
ncbi:MAG: hypothetical protein M1377_00645 [Deltaproteobacteria bacterium]|nr:hypothetical protein [Deltaproteobacteria bacterium]